MKNSVSGVVAFVCTLAGCGPRESVGDLGGMAGAVVTAGTSGSGMGQSGGSGPGGSGMESGGSGMESGGSGGAPVAVPCGSIEYPATAFYGPNVLDSAATAFPAGASPGALDFDFAARLSAGASLSVRMTLVDVSLPLPGPFPPNVWWMANAGDWLVTDFDLSTGVQTSMPTTRKRFWPWSSASKAMAAPWSSISSVARRPRPAAKPSLGVLGASQWGRD